MTPADVENALGQRLAASPSLGTIVWPNRDATPALPYLIFGHFPTGWADTTLGGGLAVPAGYAMVMVVSGLNAFATAALVIAETIRARFAYGLRLTAGTGRIVISQPPRVLPGYPGGQPQISVWHTPVRIDYKGEI